MIWQKLKRWMSGKKLILIVEDDPQLSKLLSIFLGAKGFDTTIALDGEAGMAAVDQLSPDLVVLDVTMPKVDGFGVLLKIKANPQTEKLPVLMCTDHKMLDDVEKACRYGANGYVVKPYELDRVYEKVLDLFKKAR